MTNLHHVKSVGQARLANGNRARPTANNAHSKSYLCKFLTLSPEVGSSILLGFGPDELGGLGRDFPPREAGDCAVCAVTPAVVPQVPKNLVVVLDICEHDRGGTAQPGCNPSEPNAAWHKIGGLIRLVSLYAGGTGSAKCRRIIRRVLKIRKELSSRCLQQIHCFLRADGQPGGAGRLTAELHDGSATDAAPMPPDVIGEKDSRGPDVQPVLCRSDLIRETACEALKVAVPCVFQQCASFLALSFVGLQCWMRAHVSNQIKHRSSCLDFLGHHNAGNTRQTCRMRI